MIRLRHCLLALPLLLAACAHAPAGDNDVAAVLAASGLDAQLRWLRQPLDTEKTSGPLALIPDDWIRLVNATVADTLKPDEVRNSLQDEIRKNLSARELAEVRRFYESGTGKQVVAAESGKLDRSLATPASGDQATLDALASATGLGKAVSQLAEHGLSDAVDIAVKTGCFGQNQPRFAGLLSGVMKKAQLLALRTTVNERIRQRYASLSPEDQANYLAFAQSRTGQKFFAARGAVLNAAAQQAGDALNSQLTPRINELCKTSA